MNVSFNKPTIILDAAKSKCYAPAKYLFNLNWKVCQIITKDVPAANEITNQDNYLVSFIKTVAAIIFLIPGLLLGLVITGTLLLCSKNFRVCYFTEFPHIRFQGNQYGCHGPVDLELANQVFQKIKGTAPPGIKFEDDVLMDQEWDGGTCGAMSYDFIDQYLTYAKIYSSSKAIKRTAQLRKYLGSSETFRSRQMAFCKFALDPTSATSSVDLGRNKVQSFMNYHDRRVALTSKILSIASIIPVNPRPKILTIAEKEVAKELQKVVKKLPDGAYLVNQWTPSDRLPKGQLKGHQMVYIKDLGKEFYYDPNKGTHELGKRHPKKRSLFRCISHPCKYFQYTQMRFYKIE